MNATERRNAILQQLESGAEPVSATALARKFSVSRQIIVGDVAILRASGAEIAATPRGYMIVREDGGLLRRVACAHDWAGMEGELLICVDNGCDVLDVIVEHPLYGQLVGQLQLRSRYDVSQFVSRAANSHPLSALTDGIHLHTLRCPDENAYQRVCSALREGGFLLQDDRAAGTG